MVNIWRFERDGTATVVGTWGGERPHPFQPGSNWPLEAPSIVASIQHTKAGRPVRIDDLSEVAGPIVVGGEVWGRIGAVTAEREPLPGHMEDRLADFTELVATAIANAESR